MNKYFRNFIFSLKSNYKSIILAFIISVIIWFAISLQLFPDVVRRISDVPVTIKSTAFMDANNLNLAEDYNFFTDIKVEGKRYEIGTLETKDFTAYLDFSVVVSQGNYNVPVVVTALDTDCIVTSELSTVNVDVVRISTKTIALEPVANGLEIIDDFQIDSDHLKVIPETITITGESRVVDSITRVVAKAMSNTELTATTEVGAEIVFYNDGVIIQNPNIETDNSQFSVTVPIQKVKTLPVEFSIVGYQSNFDIAGLMRKMVVYPNEITISSPDNSIDSLIRLELAQINLSELDYFNLRTIRRETIAPILPEGYGNISRNASASLTFTDIDDYNDFYFDIPADNFSLINIPAGFDATVLTKQLSVTVAGPASFVHSLNADDIAVTINMAGIEPDEGTRKISVSCRINGTNVPAWVVGNPQVDVLFSKR